MPVRIALADDHPIVLDGLAQLFRLEEDFEVVARCRDGDETLRLLRELPVDVLVLDLKMPGTDGLAVLSAVRDEKLAAKVLVLTAAIDDDQLARALHLGVAGVVLKEVAPQILVQAVRTVHAGGLWLDQSFGRTLDRMVLRGAAAREAPSKAGAPQGRSRHFFPARRWPTTWPRKRYSFGCLHFFSKQGSLPEVAP